MARFNGCSAGVEDHEGMKFIQFDSLESYARPLSIHRRRSSLGSAPSAGQKRIHLLLTTTQPTTPVQ